MKLESSQPHTTTEHSVNKKAGYSAALLSTNHLRVFCLGCCHQISHWELLKIYWFSSLHVSNSTFPYLLLECVIHLLLHAELQIKKTGINQFKRLIFMNLLFSTWQHTTTLLPLMSCGREKQHRQPELMEMMTDILFTNRLMYSPNNNTIIVNKRIPHLILHLQAVAWTYKILFCPGWVVCVTSEHRLSLGYNFVFFSP